MTEDRELLELAAKAAEIDVRRLPDAWPERFDDDQWDPLIDDGDALRLAVKLCLDVYCYTSGAYAEGDRDEYRVQEEGNDPYAATRRAIVRAAAEIGRSM